jgi:prepilin-type N-terminal cleavage/methylation domain-containing protein
MRNALVPFASSAPSIRRRVVRGFTLIEVMIVVAIIAILSAIAIPSYRDYILRGQLVDATTLLAGTRADMERYYQDNRKYTAVSAAIVPPCARTQGNFTLTCSVLTDTTFTLLATGGGPVVNFNYTITHQDVQATPSVGAAGWNTSATCWITKKGQSC